MTSWITPTFGGESKKPAKSVSSNRANTQRVQACDRNVSYVHDNNGFDGPIWENDIGDFDFEDFNEDWSSVETRSAPAKSNNTAAPNIPSSSSVFKPKRPVMSKGSNDVGF
jgi:hypothetical protein